MFSEMLRIDSTCLPTLRVDDPCAGKVKVAVSTRYFISSSVILAEVNRRGTTRISGTWRYQGGQIDICETIHQRLDDIVVSPILYLGLVELVRNYHHKRFPATGDHLRLHTPHPRPRRICSLRPAAPKSFVHSFLTSLTS